MKIHQFGFAYCSAYIRLNQYMTASCVNEGIDHLSLALLHIVVHFFRLILPIFRKGRLERLSSIRLKPRDSW